MRISISALLLIGTAFVQAATRDDYNLLTEEQQFSLAAESLSVGKVAEAVELLRSSASFGHVPSLETVAVVLLHGPALFGPNAPLDVCEAARWFNVARRLGSVLAERYYPLLVRLQLNGSIAACDDRGE